LLMQYNHTSHPGMAILYEVALRLAVFA